MPTVTIDRTGSYRNANSHTEVLRAIAIDFARLAVKGTAGLVDNSGGVQVATAMVKPLVGVAASGNNLAQKAATEAALATVLDSLGEIFLCANAVATKLGITNVVYNGGGAAPDGTVAAVSAATTGAATGTPVAALNAIIVKLNDAFYNASALVTRLAEATGVPHTKIDVFSGKLANPILAIGLDTGVAVAAAAASKADVDKALATFRDNAHALALILNATVANYTPGVRAVR